MRAVFSRSSVDFVTVIIPVVEDIQTNKDRDDAIKDLEGFSKVGISYI